MQEGTFARNEWPGGVAVAGWADQLWLGLGYLILQSTASPSLDAIPLQQLSQLTMLLEGF